MRTAVTGVGLATRLGTFPVDHYERISDVESALDPIRCVHITRRSSSALGAITVAGEPGIGLPRIRERFVPAIARSTAGDPKCSLDFVTSQRAPVPGNARLFAQSGSGQMGAILAAGR